jgi:hypothetical protein
MTCPVLFFCVKFSQLSIPSPRQDAGRGRGEGGCRSAEAGRFIASSLSAPVRKLHLTSVALSAVAARLPGFPQLSALHANFTILEHRLIA